MEDILEETLFEAKVRSLDLDNTVAEALRQVRSTQILKKSSIDFNLVMSQTNDSISR